MDASLKGAWWRIFAEPELDALEEQVDANNQNVAQSFQSFMAARAQVGQARAAYFPTIALSPSVTVSNYGSAVRGGPAATGSLSTGGTTSSFLIPLDASWAPDLWDRVRNAVRASRYAAQVSAADLENVRLTQRATLAITYFELRGQDALEAVYDRTIAADRASLEYTRAQAETGIGSPEAVAQAEVTLETATAAAIGVAANRAIFEHATATLIGKPASEFALSHRALATELPAIPVGVPSELLERRPDIAAAERTLAQANALIGVQEAAFYPSLNLTATGGLGASSLGTLFSAPALFWSLGASATETIFEGGLRSATVAQFKALYLADVAAYRQAVLMAFQQVEDALATLRVVSAQILRQQSAVDAARRNLDIALAAYHTGVDPYLNVITAQTLLLNDELVLVTLRVTGLTAAVQLVQALGGGWELRDLPLDSDVTSEDTVRRLAPAPPHSEAAH